MPNQAPFEYRPTPTATTCKPGAVEAGDWIQFFVGWPSALNGRGRNVVYDPGRFLIHMLYTPDSDEAKQQGDDRSVTFGGSGAGQTANRPRQYRIDPGWMWQAPFTGQIALIAGGESLEDVLLPVIITKGFHPRVWVQQQAILDAHGPLGGPLASVCDSPEQWLQTLGCLELEHPHGLTRGPRRFAPPIVGTPQLVPCTYVDLLPDGGGGLPLQFPDGAVSVESGEAASLTVQVLGNPLRLALPAGFRRPLGPLGQGAQVTNSTGATWVSTVALATLTFWSSLGG